jgi:energy-coupling factor transporter ATP-binding protein EcfA2
VQEPIQAYISYVQADQDFALELYRFLKESGFSPWMVHEDVFPGENISLSIKKAVRNADIFLVVYSKNRAFQDREKNMTELALNQLKDSISSKHITASSPFKDLESEIEFFRKESLGRQIIIPIRLDDSPILGEISSIQFVDLRKDKNKGFQRLLEGINRLTKSIGANSVISTKNLKPNRILRDFSVSKIEIENIRCFDKLTINFSPNASSVQWAMILGDNAVGKSTLLRCIALGLCKESDAVALMKAVSGGFVRKGAQEGFIKIHLREDKNSKRPKKYTITTRISQKSEDGSEIVRQETEPAKAFPWSDIFVCGYGAYRAAQAHSSFEQYEVRDAVVSLFDPQASLQNPEIVLLRHDPEVREKLEQKLLQILMLDEPGYKMNFTKRGLELEGPWGCLPFQVLSDGYRSTTQWVLDFIGWLIHAERLIDNPDIGGILLIDELEQHLHPRWQRYIVQRLRQQFPKTQIIASTHTPLAASGIVDEEDSLLLKLEQTVNGSIDLKVLDKQLLAGKRADQVLTSEAFGLLTTRNPGSEDEIDRYTVLLGKIERTEVEETELQELKLRVQNTLRSGENAVEQMVATTVDETLQSMTHNISPERLSLETRKQLQQLFQSEASE